MRSSLVDVPVCASCGHENREGAKFCEECGFSFAVARPPAKEQRKTVTVLFCDLTGSTALGETLDPERLRALLARYFERMKSIVEWHGGSVEKFIGDAVMAVFGVPVLHEDDALRAVRAAVEMRDALPELGLPGRIGVMTGEVVTGTEERLATGDAVNVAARLEQAAQPGEVLVGQPTLALLEGAVEVEAVEPLVLKGKAEPVPAYRLLGVRKAPKRRHEALFVGRERELAILREAWERVQVEQRCELLTLVGDAGVGKSRLAAEALASTKARVVRGRCLPYGEGITYWPVVEVVRQLDALPSDPAAAAAIRSLLGETDAATSAEEIAWAFRKLLEEQAPLVVLFDDVQWGEVTFLDLVEHVALLSSGAPIMLLFMARPELLDCRPSWSVTVRLEPLGTEDVNRLVGARVPDELRAKIADAAGGNPLFIGEMLAVAEEAGGEVVVPPTLRALLAARLDQLDTAERRVLERGAVEGEIFHRGAVQALAPEETQVTPRLAALVRRELIRPDRAQFAGEDGFRFRHLLIRDATYDALPKSTRAELHERFADWLEQRGEELVELDEILGYHLEQAVRYKQELGQPDSALTERAGERLAAAGRRALWRGDERAAAGLLERALILTRPARVDVVLELDLAQALLRDSPKAAAIADAAAERARVAGDETGEALARVGAAYYRVFFAADPAVNEVEELARKALPLLEQAEDHAGLVHVWNALGYGVANWRCRFEDWAQAAEQVLRHARLAGQRSSRLFPESALALGPRPADEALRTVDALLPENPHPASLLTRAWLLAMLARFEEASQIAREAGERWRELTGDDWVDWMLAQVAATAGDHEAAAEHLRRFCELVEVRGQRGFLSTFAAMRGRFLCTLGRHDEAEPLAQLGREIGGEQAAIGQALWRQAQALVHARRGEHAEAEQLAREAVAITERTDSLNVQGDALCDLAEVLHAAGRTKEAAAALEQALECYERKKNRAMAAQVRERLGELQDAAPR
jgi:class 3 adenylate cyclase/tetratricopeptide (TPR) repeat protein